MTDVIPPTYKAVLEVGFTSSSAELELCEQRVKLHILRMDGATMLFVCQAGVECFDELGVALAPTLVNVKPSSTTLLGSEFASKSQRLAEQLSKYYGRQFFVSYNIPVDSISGPLLDRQICEYVRSHEATI